MDLYLNLPRKEGKRFRVLKNDGRTIDDKVGPIVLFPDEGTPVPDPVARRLLKQDPTLVGTELYRGDPLPVLDHEFQKHFVLLRIRVKELADGFLNRGATHANTTPRALEAYRNAGNALYEALEVAPPTAETPLPIEAVADPIEAVANPEDVLRELAGIDDLLNLTKKELNDYAKKLDLKVDWRSPKDAFVVAIENRCAELAG